MIRLLLGSLVFGAVTVSAVSAAAPAGVVTGQVFRDARTIQCVRAPCLEPASGVVLSFERVKPAAKRVSVRTDASGRFRASLAPGVYRVRGAVLQLDPTRAEGPFRISVKAGRSVRLSLRIGRGGGETSASGVTGRVVKSPIRPVCEESVPCSAPAARFPLLFTKDGAVVARVTTSAAGTFRLGLPPGRYVVTSAVKFPFGGAAPVAVRVFPARFAVVDLAVDTGIR